MLMSLLSRAGPAFVALVLIAAPVHAQPAPDQAAAEALDALHAAAARADADAYFDRLSPDLIWVGNAVEERWDNAGFRAFADPVFARGEGWTYSARERRVFMASDPCQCVAWFDEMLDSATYGTAVGTGVILLEHGEWRVWRYALTYPIPNDLAHGMTDEIKAWEAANPRPGPGRQAPITPEQQPIWETLDAFHQAASEHNAEAYFALYAPDGHYRGTDVTEFWTTAEFRAFAEPYFASGRGWTYLPRERHVSIAPSPCACVAWFDETLDSQSYGTSRGTGVLTRDGDAWRIAYYALTFPIPNELARDMTARIVAAGDAAG